MGGCIGSTSSGLKMARVRVLFTHLNTQISKFSTPHTTIVPYYNKKPISKTVTESVMGYFFLYILVFSIISSPCCFYSSIN